VYGSISVTDTVCLSREEYKSMIICAESSSVIAELLLEVFKERWVTASIQDVLLQV